MRPLPPGEERVRAKLVHGAPLGPALSRSERERNQTPRTCQISSLVGIDCGVVCQPPPLGLEHDRRAVGRLLGQPLACVASRLNLRLSVGAARKRRPGVSAETSRKWGRRNGDGEHAGSLPRGFSSFPIPHSPFPISAPWPRLLTYCSPAAGRRVIFIRVWPTLTICGGRCPRCRLRLPAAGPRASVIPYG